MTVDVIELLSDMVVWLGEMNETCFRTSGDVHEFLAGHVLYGFVRMLRLLRTTPSMCRPGDFRKAHVVRKSRRARFRRASSSEHLAKLASDLL